MPFEELGFHSCDDLLESAKIAIVKPKAAQQLPDTLNGIEDGRIGRQIIETEAGRFLLSPVFVQQGVVVFGIVGDDDNLPSRNPADFLELDQELPEGLEFPVRAKCSPKSRVGLRFRMRCCC